jgi:DNA replication protein DnaC
MKAAAPRAGLAMKLRALKLPSFVTHHAELAGRAETEGWPFDRFLDGLADLELEERTRRRIERVLKAAHLPPEKTLATLDLARLPVAVKRQLPTLCEGGFIERADNILAFGLPGRGKTHVLAAIGHELVKRGYRVVFVAAFRLVQQLLAAKRTLTLEAELRRLDAVDALIVDDIGYIQQDREEMEVLFTLFAERYERRSVLISSNLVFSQWDRIFKDPMTTACAIDRVVHHATILELTGSSYRTEAAKQRNGGRGPEGSSAPPPKEAEA